MKRNQDNDPYAVMYRPSREPFETYPTENAACRAMQAGDYKADSDASPEDVCIAVWDDIRGWIEHKANAPDSWTLEALTDGETAAEAERIAQQDRQREQREEIRRRQAAPMKVREPEPLSKGFFSRRTKTYFQAGAKRGGPRHVNAFGDNRGFRLLGMGMLQTGRLKRSDIRLFLTLKT